MASPKKLFAKLNISIKTHFVSYTFYVTFAVILLIYFLHMHAFFLFHIFFKVLKSNVHRNFFSVYILNVSFTFSLGWVGMGRGRNLGRFSHRFLEGKGGLHSDFCIAIVVPFMCLVSAVTRHKKGIRMYVFNVCIMCIIMYVYFHSINT